MEYTLTKHARKALEKRRIRMEWVGSVIDYPQWIENDAVDPDLIHHLAEIPEFGDRVLRVILNASVDPPRIVTVHFDRRRK